MAKKDTPQLPSLNEGEEESVPPPLPPKSYNTFWIELIHVNNKRMHRA